MQDKMYRNTGTVRNDSGYAAEDMSNVTERTMILSANLKRFREARGLTQEQVWEASGISKSSYTSYEAGRSMPSGDKIVAMAKVLRCTTDELLLNADELSVSQDLAPILRRFEALPEAARMQARIALKGVLFGYEQEALR